MTTTRLIERWLPIADIGEESARERRSMTALPGIYFLHVWWARRPLVASRAAVLASLLPANTDRAAFKHALGIHGNPSQTKIQIDIAKRTKRDLGPNPYGYRRAFQFHPHEAASAILPDIDQLTVLDPTAGGGAIPLEAMRLGAHAIANDINPVASLIIRATAELPARFGAKVIAEYDDLVQRYSTIAKSRLVDIYPDEGKTRQVDGYLWARTLSCPYCGGVIPMSPSWNLNTSGVGVKLNAMAGSGYGDPARKCSFQIVETEAEHSQGTVAKGDALCPFNDCGRTVDGDEIKRQAQEAGLGDQLYAVVFREEVSSLLPSGRKTTSWVRKYRAPAEDDENLLSIKEKLHEKLEEWDVLDTIPNEQFPEGTNDDRPRIYGMPFWRDMFSPRQLLAHGTCVETFRLLYEQDSQNGQLSDLKKAAYIYLSIALDSTLNYGNRSCRWDSTSQRVRSIFDRHDFAFCWSYSEMALAHAGAGLDWALKKTRKALIELVGMVADEKRGDLLDATKDSIGSIVVTNQSGSMMQGINSGTVDAIVMDPPYGANVMYAELSDFFYVWLKRTAGLVYPEAFTRKLTDKEGEAVANRAHFKGQKSAARLADDDYRIKMEGIFAECRRVLKDDGIMTVMFTHKDTGAWDALAMSLMDAGFVITASWPVNTEASGSLHIKDKAAANSTIFLVCRPRGGAEGETMYWEDVEPEVARAVRDRVGEFQTAGIQGVDLYLASFGPALEAFSRHWPLTRGTPAPEPKKKRRTQADMFEEFDPYAVRPEDALNAARREVKAWRLAQLASAKAQADMDGPTAFYVLAWDAFKAVSFPYDEALRLARAVGVDLDTQVIGRLAEKKAAEIKLWDSATRVAKGAVGPADGSRGMIDALHHAAHVMRTRGAEAAQEMLNDAGIAKDDEFKVAMEALLEVLPPSKTFSGIDADKAVKPAADDFDALEKLRRIAYESEIGEPAQLELYREMMVSE
jgi:putative DNA methylase